MFHLATFDEIAGIAHGIETTNPAMVDRIRRAADRLNRYEIAARLAQAIAEAADAAHVRSEEHTSELQSLMRISYAVFCLKKKNSQTNSDTYSTPIQHYR